LHSKPLIVDNNKLSIGSCNMDNRSFALNFEDTVLIYSKKHNEEFVKLFEKDVNSSMQVDENYFKKKKWITKILQAIMRLLSSLL